MRANFAVAGLIKMAAALLLAVQLFSGNTGRVPLLALCGIILGAAVMTTHSVARLDDRGILMLATTLHLLGAAVWIGGIPAFVMALVPHPRWRQPAARRRPVLAPEHDRRRLHPGLGHLVQPVLHRLLGRSCMRPRMA